MVLDHFAGVKSKEAFKPFCTKIILSSELFIIGVLEIEDLILSVHVSLNKLRKRDKM